MTLSVTTKFIQFNEPDISTEEEMAVTSVLRSGWLGNGPVTRDFEHDFATFMADDVHCVAVSSCTMGLILALRAKNIGQGAEVITTPLTFAATINAIIAVGAKPVFVDVNSSGLLNPVEVFKVITPKTRAIIPVHLHGAPCDVDTLNEIARQKRLVVIEDAAHAFGNKLDLGCKGDFGVFSFYPTKNITTGDGGMVVCKSKQDAEFVRTMASQGLSASAWMRYGSGPVRSYQVESEGYKGLMNDLSASIGRVQLRRWPEMEERRSEVWSVYERAFGRKEQGHSKHIYAVRVRNRFHIQTKLHEAGIGTGIHYNPLHLEPAYSFLGLPKKGAFANAEKIGSETLSLPLSSKMTVEDAERVVQAVKDATGEK